VVHFAFLVLHHLPLLKNQLLLVSSFIRIYFPQFIDGFACNFLFSRYLTVKEVLKSLKVQMGSIWSFQKSLVADVFFESLKFNFLLHLKLLIHCSLNYLEDFLGQEVVEFLPRHLAVFYAQLRPPSTSGLEQLILLPGQELLLLLGLLLRVKGG
jgi:hypothetical protein